MELNVPVIAEVLVFKTIIFFVDGLAVIIDVVIDKTPPIVISPAIVTLRAMVRLFNVKSFVANVNVVPELIVRLEVNPPDNKIAPETAPFSVKVLAPIDNRPEVWV